MNETLQSDNYAEEVWRDLLMNGDIKHARRRRRFFKHIPSNPRCAHCLRPFRGLGGFFVRTFSEVRPSKLNPRYCNDCETFAKKHPGGAEVELAMLFADVRGSTALAEKMSTTEFTQLINRFYQQTSNVLIQADALIEKLIGDEVAALFVPGYAGQNYTLRAVEAAREILRVTGHFDKSGPWIPVGIGVHKGRAFVGAVGSTKDVVEITALGDAVNVTARLSQNAEPGEILVSESACNATSIDYEEYEKRRLDLKGRSGPISVRIMRAVEQKIRNVA